MKTRREVLTGAGALTLAACATPAPTPERQHTRPLAIAHRGCSGERPEHTIGGYKLAIAYGADFIEPDCVITKDGVLVVRHENEISQTTDIAAHPEFAARRTTKVVDGQKLDGWFTEDFTLVELRTLRCKERLPQIRPQNTAYDGQEPIPTLQDVIDLAKAETAARGRTIGIYPETKHSTYFNKIGLPLEGRLLETLNKAGWTEKTSPVFIQSFEVKNLQALRSQTRVRLIQLVTGEGGPADGGVSYSERLTPAGLKEIARYADGIGAEKNLIIPRASDQSWLKPTTLVNDAHTAGLQVHAWTFRIENTFLPRELRLGDPRSDTYAREHGDIKSELLKFFDLGIDGFFSDNSHEAVLIRDYFAARGRLTP